MKPYYVAVKDGDDYRHLVEHIKCDKDLMNFQEHVAELILGTTEYFDEFRETTISFYETTGLVDVTSRTLVPIKCTK